MLQTVVFAPTFICNHAWHVGIKSGNKTQCLQTPNLHPSRKVTPGRPPQFNTLDGCVDRKSHWGNYEVVRGVPR